MSTAPTDTTIYSEKFIENIAVVLTAKKEYLGLKDIKTNEEAYIVRYPTVTIELDHMTEEWIRIPRQKKLTGTFNITYYHESFTEKTRRSETRKALDKLATVLRENWTLNGYTTRHGSTVESVTPYVIAGGKNLVAGGVLTLICHKEVTVTFV